MVVTTRKRKERDATIVNTGSTPILITSEDNIITPVPKPAKVSDKVTQPLLCPITHTLMVDPVLADDGHTYERSSIEEWLLKNRTSPLNPNKRMKVARLAPVKILRESIEALVETGAIEDKLSDCWKEKKNELNLNWVKAKKLYDEGRILEAAKLGLPEAQGKLSHRYYFGKEGVEKDLCQSLEWARKAARGGNRWGQFRMGLFYDVGITGVLTSDRSEAISYYEKAAEQGCGDSMHNLGCIYNYGGCQLHHNYLQKAAFWYEKAAKMNQEHSLITMGELCYKGKGVTKNHKVAREWFEKAIDVIDTNSNIWLKANYKLGRMMARGEGGSKDIAQGITLIQKAASKGLSVAEKCMDDIACSLVGK